MLNGFSFHYSFRRQLIDRTLQKHSTQFNGCVLDVGGKKAQKKGKFRPPALDAVTWVCLNRTGKETPDIIGDAHVLPFKSGCSDWVVCIEVLEFILNPAFFFRELSRVLKPNGQLLLTVPFLYRIHDHPYDLQRFTEEKLKLLLSESGFKIKEAEAHGYYFTVLADQLKAAFAQISLYPLRLLSAIFAVPLLMFLRWLDGLSFVRRSAFFTSYTTGFAILAVKN